MEREGFERWKEGRKRAERGDRDVRREREKRQRERKEAERERGRERRRGRQHYYTNVLDPE